MSEPMTARTSEPAAENATEPATENATENATEPATESVGATRDLRVPASSLVVLVGVSGSGKSTFAREHFGPYETVSSDVCRGLVSNDENDQAATRAAFEVLETIVSKRLEANLLTVVDATNVQREARKTLVALARAHDVLPVAIVLDVPEKVAVERNAARADRGFGAHVVKRQRAALRSSLKSLQREGFRTVHVLRGEDEVAAARIVRTPLLTDRRDEHGPFDAIGDVHGCLDELVTLLGELGYAVVRDDAGRPVDAAHPAGRRAIFLGDLVDRGPDSPGVLRLAMGMVRAGHALAVPGNHEHKLVRALGGRDVKVSHGLETTLAQLADEPEEFRREVAEFCRDLVSHLVLDDGRLVVAHAGLKESYQGRASGRVRSFALYGDTTGETDEFGLPVRYPWADDYRGRAMVLYGHTPTPEAEWVNNTMCLDTGCVFGGRLSALRYPEKEVVQVPAAREYYAPARPFLPEDSGTGGASAREPDLLSVADVLGRRAVETATHGRVTVGEEQAAGALEVMSRFAVDPRLLLYLPPTMSPVATSTLPGLLEHPDGAFAAYARDGVDRVVCEEKHMGSRAVLLVARDSGSADGSRVVAERFGIDAPGAVHTRTGRSFLDAPTTALLLGRVAAALAAAGTWDALGADWVLLDAEVLPWSLKADQLLRDQYASVGAAARAVMPSALAALAAAEARGVDVGEAPASDRAAVDRRRAVRRVVPALPLGHGRGRGRRRRARPAARRAGRAVPGARERDVRAARVRGAGRDDVRRARPPVAPRRRGPARRGGPGAVPHDAARRRRPRRRRVARRGDGLVGGAHGGRRRGHGGQAGRQPRAAPGRAREGRRARAARAQGPRPGVPAHHLRPRVHRGAQPRTAARAVAGAQAVPRAAGVRPRSRGARQGGAR